jgi:hypothetical protein
VYTIFLLLYVHAYHKREELELNEYVNWSGWIYAAIFPVLFISGNLTDRRKRALQQRVTRSQPEASKSVPEQGTKE